MEYIIFVKIVLSILLGWLIGLERDISKKNDVEQFGGLRTFSIISLLWSLSVILDSYMKSWFFVYSMFFCVLAFVLTSYAYSSFKRGEIGLTSEFSAIISFIIWVVIWLWHNTLWIIIAISTVMVISMKEYSMRIIASVSKDEFLHSMKFAVIAFVILPLLPDHKYSISNLLWHAWMDVSWFNNQILNLQFFNPYSIWFFVVVISAVWYIWYILSKFLGKNGSVIISSLVGWMVSSTAVTATMSEQSKNDNNNPYLYAMGVLLANSVMLVRVIVIVLLFNIALIGDLWLPALLMLSWFLMVILYSYIKSKATSSNLSVWVSDKMESPFSIVPALKFWLFILFIKFIAGIGLLYKDIIGWDLFYYALWIISWFADVDAITQTMTTQSKEWMVVWSIAVSTILIAVMSNNIIKGSVAFKFWGSKFSKIVILAFTISMVLWLVGMFIL